jgi:hypothetical protein
MPPLECPERIACVCNARDAMAQFVYQGWANRGRACISEDFRGESRIEYAVLGHWRDGRRLQQFSPASFRCISRRHSAPWRHPLVEDAAQCAAPGGRSANARKAAEGNVCMVATQREVVATSQGRLDDALGWGWWVAAAGPTPVVFWSWRLPARGSTAAASAPSSAARSDNCYALFYRSIRTPSKPACVIGTTYRRTDVTAAAALVPGRRALALGLRAYRPTLHSYDPRQIRSHARLPPASRGQAEAVQ